jgi:hypothetical protein
MKHTLLSQILGLEQKKNCTQAFVFYLIYLSVSFILMILLFMSEIIIANIRYGEAFELTYSITRIATPIIIILISTYICYKKNILDRITLILLILLSAFSSLFFLTISGLLIPAYLTCK